MSHRKESFTREIKRRIVSTSIASSLLLSSPGIPLHNPTLTADQPLPQPGRTIQMLPTPAPDNPDTPQLKQAVEDILIKCLILPALGFLPFGFLLEKKRKKDEAEKRRREQAEEQQNEAAQPATKGDIDSVAHVLRDHHERLSHIENQLNQPSDEVNTPRQSPAKPILLIAGIIASAALLANPAREFINSTAGTHIPPLPLPIPQVIDTTKMPDPTLLPTPIPHIETKHAVTQAEAQDAGKTIFLIIAALAGSTIGIKFLFGGKKRRE